MITLADAIVKKTSSVKASQKEPSSAAKKRNLANNTTSGKTLCVYHGNELVANNFYRAHSSSVWRKNIIDDVPYVGICKACIKDIYMNYLMVNNNDQVKALYYTCRRMDVKFDLKNAAAAVLRSTKKESAEVIGNYFGMLNSLPQNTTDGNFDASDVFHVTEGESMEDIYNKTRESVKLDSSDKKMIKEILKRIGYNPFANYKYDDYDLKQLYTDLMPYLEDDEIISDGYKLPIIIQIINNNHQIRTIDLYISIVNSNIKDFTENMSVISSLTAQKQKLIQANVSLIDKNKWLNSQGVTNKNKLSGMMKYMRELQFEDALPNYFDDLTSEATKTVVDISNRSIMDSINFGENDQKEIFQMQREMIVNKDEEIVILKEQLKRTAKELVETQKRVDGVE